jgi:hypothetical protein
MNDWSAGAEAAKAIDVPEALTLDYPAMFLRAPSALAHKPLIMLVERFQSSNHMGCSKRPHPCDGKSKMQLCGFMESVV